MRIALVSEHASPLALLGSDDAGGQNVHVAELARALGRRGVEVVVHTRRDDPSQLRRVEFAPNVVVDHVPAGPAEPIAKDELLPHMAAFADDLAATWSADPPDVVHSHFWMSGLATLAASRRVAVPMLHTFHALGIEKRRQQGGQDTSPGERIAIEAAIARQADALVATTAVESCALQRMGASPTRVAVVPCGVDLSRFHPDGPAHRRRPGWARIVAASRLVPRKGVGELITALARVPRTELVIAGGPPAGLVDDADEGIRLSQLARRAGVADRVTFLGAVCREEMPALLRSADVVACCPWYEPFGLVAVEAMACGVPVLATAVGGLAETVVHGTTGAHVRPRDPDSIASGLSSLLADDAARRRMGEAAAARARTYGWDDVAERTLEVAHDVLAPRTARREVG
ncbi:glycosyltransferase [Iamia sp.]|uniref:glycosyltransferase n=1 Tax=Iamia sp. TaxID=2722710 RepID=UPI002BBD1D33|nr:glycosyltransferase [Iamia sp.]HXH59388.1 glycosyltransferase [Iamia sp.]